MEEGEISSDSSHREGGHRRGDKVRDTHRESQVEALLRKKKKIERELRKVQHQSHSHRSPEKRHSSTKKRKKRSRSRTRSRTRSREDCSTLSPRKSSRRRERRDRAVTELAREEREMVRQRRRLLESGQEAAGDVLRGSHHSHRATESSPRDNRRREERSASVDTAKVIVQKRGRLFARALAAVAPGKVEEDDDVVEEEVVEVPVPPKVVEVIQLDDDDDEDDEAKGDSKASPHPLTRAFARLLVEEVLGRAVLVADRRVIMERDKASQHQRRLQRLRDKKEAARAMEKSRELKAQVSLALGGAWQAMANNWSSSEDVGKDQEYHGKEKTRSGDFW